MSCLRTELTRFCDFLRSCPFLGHRGFLQVARRDDFRHLPLLSNAAYRPRITMPSVKEAGRATSSTNDVVNIAFWNSMCKYRGCDLGSDCGRRTCFPSIHFAVDAIAPQDT